MSEIGPFEVLMLLCSYKERTKEVIDPKKLESEELKLSDLLTEEDFIMARSVSIVPSVFQIVFASHTVALCVSRFKVLI